MLKTYHISLAFDLGRVWDQMELVVLCCVSVFLRFLTVVFNFKELKSTCVSFDVL